MKFVTIVGARPQFIKAAPLSAELRRRHTEFLLHTGQHYDDNMSDVFFRELGIPKPDCHLGVGSGLQGAQTAQMLAKIEQVLLEVAPDAVIVYGDTNSTVAGALAAAKLNIAIAHVEAGLRSFDRTMPEEINRIVADHVSTWLFAPSAASVGQLATEGITRGVRDVGDIMADSVRMFSESAQQSSTVLDRLGLRKKDYLVATVHRAANTDDARRMSSILAGLSNSGEKVICPLHPRARAAMVKHGLTSYLDAAQGRLVIVEPLGYLDMLKLLEDSLGIATDSGGLQKEAYYLGVPCLTLRDSTEWVETVETGWNTLVGADAQAIGAAVGRLRDFASVSRPVLYGDGHAARRIVAALETPDRDCVRTAKDGQ